MATVNEKMTAIADEIRELSGTTEAMGLDAMASTLNTENANFNTNLTAQDNLIAQIQATVDSLPDVGSSEPNLQSKTITPITSEQIVVPDFGYDGLSQVIVSSIPKSYIQPSGTLKINRNDLYNVENYAFVEVSVGTGGGGDDDDLGTGGDGGYDNPEIGDEDGGGPPGTSTGTFVTSSAAGQIIYVTSYQNKISTVQGALEYFNPLGYYRCHIDNPVMNTPIICLTSGTVDIPSRDGATTLLITSGDGYQIYQYHTNT